MKCWRALKSAHAGGTRIASICSGAFTLAEAGLLDGKRATTHWLAADLFRATSPPWTSTPTFSTSTRARC